MSLFDDLAGQATAALANFTRDTHPGLLGEVTQMLGANNGGGLQSLLAQLQANGHGQAVASWIGTGANLPISPEQLQSVLGSGQIAAIAQKLGLSSTDASSALAKLLPQVVNHLTPNGQLPANDMLQQGLTMLRSLSNKA
jgi:uncharacterized protein YidB (DUF937 family)